MKRHCSAIRTHFSSHRFTSKVIMAHENMCVYVCVEPILSFVTGGLRSELHPCTKGSLVGTGCPPYTLMRTYLLHFDDSSAGRAQAAL